MKKRTESSGSHLVKFVADRVDPMATLLAAVEATLLGKDEQLVAKCNVPGILAVF